MGNNPIVQKLIDLYKSGIVGERAVDNHLHIHSILSSKSEEDRNAILAQLKEENEEAYGNVVLVYNILCNDVNYKAAINQVVRRSSLHQMKSSEMEHNPTHTASSHPMESSDTHTVSEEFDYDYFSDFDFEG